MERIEPKYFQQTLFGDEVQVDKHGNPLTQYRIEYHPECGYCYCRYWKAAKLSEVIKKAKEWLADYDNEFPRIRSLKIIDHNTDQVVKEYKRVASIKR